MVSGKEEGKNDLALSISVTEDEAFSAGHGHMVGQ